MPDQFTAPCWADCDSAELVNAAARFFSTRAEMLDGHLIVSPPQDFAHSTAVLEVAFQLKAAAVPHVDLGSGYATTPGTGPRTLVLPDVAVMSRKPTASDIAHRTPDAVWYSTGILAMAVEVTSDNHEIDTGPKHRAYAAAGVPVYVIVHRQRGRVFVHTDRAGSRYLTTASRKLGDKLPLPAPYPPLDTSALLG
ncbi:Uma2 family endonuclease [Streptomyces cinnamoneus]|uniref:Uma2 family endonuclease n=1 Tax=Streptomyces cinnamoneus TaxID=53446 RepID=UPI0034014C94